MPGPFLTDISKAWAFDGAPDGTGGGANPFADYALQRAGNPSEIVGAALFLMSDASSYTTGSIPHRRHGVASTGSGRDDAEVGVGPVQHAHQLLQRCRVAADLQTG